MSRSTVADKGMSGLSPFAKLLKRAGVAIYPAQTFAQQEPRVQCTRAHAAKRRRESRELATLLHGREAQS